MAALSLWFDLFAMTGMAQDYVPDMTPDLQRPVLGVHDAAVGSLILQGIYLGDFEKGWGADAPMGFWDWMPKCITAAQKVCGYPLPDEWSSAMRGGWHWERDVHKGQKFVALTERVPWGKKIGAIAGFKVQDFKGYNPRGNNGKPWKLNTIGSWVVNDGHFRLSGTWQFVNLINT
jgi:hypothetical protein